MCSCDLGLYQQVHEKKYAIKSESASIKKETALERKKLPPCFKVIDRDS